MELRLPAPCLVVLIGPSSSGKSTWAAETFHPTEIVSSDRLRAMVGAGEDDQQAGTAAFAVLEQIVVERLGRKLTTVIDTLGFDVDNRRRWVGLAHDANLPAVAVVFDTSAEDTRRHNTARPRPLPKSVLDKQISRLRAVRAEIDADGFDHIVTEQPLALVAPAIAGAGDPVVEVARPDQAGHTFGLVINRFDWGDDRSQLAARLASIAHRAESAGFRDLWVMDHFRQIPQVGREWEDMPEAYTTLSYLSGHTSIIRLGALVSAVGHRHPVVLGKMMATLDVLSGGRANLGLGLGWDRKEHEGYGIPFPSTPVRYEMLEDTLRMLPLLWGKGSPSFNGTTFSAPDLVCYPRPIQDRIPILIGGSGEKRTLRLVARYADACNLFGQPDVIRGKVDVLAAHCAEIDRDPDEIEVTHLVNVLTAPDRKSLRARVDQLRSRNIPADTYVARHNAGTVEDQLDHIGAYQRAGARHSMVVMPDVDREGSIENFAEVIAGLSRP